jgi:nucleotide-binding universal stress UspA family protein
MTEIKRILLPTDFSDDSRYAARYAADLAARFEARIHCLHVNAIPADLVGSEGAWASETASRFVASLAADNRRALEAFVRDHLSDLRVETVFIDGGTPYRKIVEYAGRHDMDLIVISTHGRTGLRHALLGSVAERVVRWAPCPVLVVKRSPPSPIVH